MGGGKKITKYATIRSVLSIVWLLIVATGCVPRARIPDERFQRAEQLVYVGTELMRKGRLQEAERVYELAAEVAPVASAIDGQGCVALLENRLDQAEGYFLEAYDMDGAYDDVLLNLGLLYQLKGQSAKARAIYLDYLSKWPESPRARNDLAVLEYESGQGRMEVLGQLEKARALSNHEIIRANIDRLGLP